MQALVPADQVYPAQRPPSPPWPFIAWGVADGALFEASGVDGSALVVRLHAYAETTGEGDDTIPGEDRAHEIVRALVALLEGAEINLAGTGCPWPAVAHVHCTGTQVLADNADGSAWHGVVSLAITIIS